MLFQAWQNQSGSIISDVLKNLNLAYYNTNDFNIQLVD